MQVIFPLPTPSGLMHAALIGLQGLGDGTFHHMLMIAWRLLSHLEIKLDS